MTRNYLIHILKQHGVITSSNSLNPVFNKRMLANPGLTQMVLDATSFLHGGPAIKTRLHVLLMGVTEQPICSQCNVPVHMQMTGKSAFTFPSYCSSKCLGKDAKVNAARMATNYQRYGAASYVASSEGRERAKQVNMERYGVEHAGAAAVNIKKRQATCLERYGFTSPLKAPQIRQKCVSTNLVRYGTENAGAAPGHISKRKATCIKRYGVENPFQLSEFQAKADATMIKKYGTAIPYHISSVLERGKQTTRVAMGAPRFELGASEYERVTSLLDDRDWCYDQHVYMKKTLTKISEELCVSPSMVCTYFEGHGIEIASLATSQAERDIVAFIATVYDGVIETRCRNVIPPKEVDIYLPHKQLAIEVNGVFWHGERKGKNESYHIDKTTRCNASGVRLIHITDTEWLTKQPIVKSRISSLLGVNNVMPARKTSVRVLTSPEAREFFDANHIQGGGVKASIAYGLVHDDRVVAAMSFGRARYSKKAEWELLRYANILYTTVVGGAGKLFSHFIRTHQPHSVISYSDKRWNTGNVYKTVGFGYSHTSPPNYYYFSPPNTQKLYHRSQFQKHKLVNLLETFDPALTEWENMKNNGFDRIWDCGSDVWVFTPEAGRCHQISGDSQCPVSPDRQ